MFARRNWSGMRRGRVVGSVLALAAAVAAVVAPAWAADTWRPGTHMTQAIARVSGAVRVITDRSPMGLDDGICLMGAFVRPGASVDFRRPLNAGDAYAFLGGGSDTAQDVDIHLFGPDGVEVARDSDSDATPMVAYKSLVGGMHTVRVTLYRAGTGSFCALAVMREGGWNVPVTNLASAAARAVSVGQVLSDNLPLSVRYHQEPNQWCVFGSVLRSGSDTTITNIYMETGRHALVTVGDDKAQDLDLFLLDETGGTIASDTDPRSVAVVDTRTVSNGGYQLRIKNSASTGASLVITSLIDLQ